MSNLTMMAIVLVGGEPRKILDANDIVVSRVGRNNGQWDCCSCFCRHHAQQPGAHSFRLCRVNCRWRVRPQLLLYEAMSYEDIGRSGEVNIDE